MSNNLEKQVAYMVLARHLELTDSFYSGMAIRLKKAEESLKEKEGDEFWSGARGVLQRLMQDYRNFKWKERGLDFIFPEQLKDE